MTNALKNLGRPGAQLAGLALVAGLLVGCGGGSDDPASAGASAPTSASTEEFCSGFGDFFTAMLGGSTSDAAAAVSALRKAGATFAETGTPSDIPDDARHGFEVFTGVLSKIKADASIADLQNLDSDIDPADQKDVQTFFTWATTACPDALGSATSVPSPTESPS